MAFHPPCSTGAYLALLDEQGEESPVLSQEIADF
jgi:hypothetical protein